MTTGLLAAHAACSELETHPREEGQGDEEEEDELAVVGGHGSADSTTEYEDARASFIWIVLVKYTHVRLNLDANPTLANLVKPREPRAYLNSGINVKRKTSKRTQHVHSTRQEDRGAPSRSTQVKPAHRLSARRENHPGHHRRLPRVTAQEARRARAQVFAEEESALRRAILG